MADRVLYFPSIRAPHGEWFARVVLYWDSVATIVPAEFIQQPEKLKLYTSELIEHGLLEAVSPDETIWQVGATNYRQPFLDLIDGTPGLVTDAPLDRPTTRIHTDKTGTGLAHDLIERTLARYIEGPEHASWFEVERQTADLLMAYLAGILSRGPTVPRMPITDRRESLEAFGRLHLPAPADHAAEGVVAKTEPIRTQILRDLLPAPAGVIRVYEIAEFKKANGDRLKRFRHAIEEALLEIAVIEDPTLRARKLEVVSARLTTQKQTIAAQMEQRGWRRIGFGTLMAVGATAATVADFLVTGGMTGLAKASGTFGLIGAVYDAFTKPSKKLLTEPMAYAALSARKLGRATG